MTRITYEMSPCTAMNNRVLHECNNLEALGLWCYLRGQPEGSSLNGEEIKNHFGAPRHKISECLKYLEMTGLVDRTQLKNADGSMELAEYMVRSTFRLGEGL